MAPTTPIRKIHPKIMSANRLTQNQLFEKQFMKRIIWQCLRGVALWGLLAGQIYADNLAIR